VTNEGAVGQHPQPALAERGQDTANEDGTQASAVLGRVDLGERQSHSSVGHVIGGPADELVLDPEFEAGTVGDVHHGDPHRRRSAAARKDMRTYAELTEPIPARPGRRADRRAKGLRCPVRQLVGAPLGATTTGEQAAGSSRSRRGMCAPYAGHYPVRYQRSVTHGHPLSPAHPSSRARRAGLYAGGGRRHLRRLRRTNSRCSAHPLPRSGTSVRVG
jgi:hypothetical protein